MWWKDLVDSAFWMVSHISRRCFPKHGPRMHSSLCFRGRTLEVQGDRRSHDVTLLEGTFLDGECQRRVPRDLTASIQSAQVLLSLPGEPPRAFEPTQPSGWLLSQLALSIPRKPPMPSASLVHPSVSL